MRNYQTKPQSNGGIIQKNIPNSSGSNPDFKTFA